MSSPSTSKPSDESKPKQADTKTDNKEKETEKDSNTATSHIGVLEEDDEFEEFPAADWDDSETDLAHLAGAAPGAAKSGGDKLWEDNWDDDDIEDEFSVQLRNELAKTGKGITTTGGGDSMQH